MRAAGCCSVMGPWAPLALVVPGSWAGDALCPVMLRSIMDGAHQCETAESRTPQKHLSIWARN